jgi:transcriptional regulator with XRE-family HTH domain
VLPHLSTLLKARREARGLSQDQAAALLGVDKETVSRWERGKNKPSGQSVIEKLKEIYELLQSELDEAYLDWALKESENAPPYRIRGYEYLSELGIDEEQLLERLIEIDTAIVPNVTLKDEGTVAQWAPIFHASPFTWKLLTKGDQIIGYWHYVCLDDASFSRVKARELRDAEIALGMLEFPSYRHSESSFRMYITMIGIDSTHLNPFSGTKLMRSFLQDVELATNSGLFFSEIAAVAFTPYGLSLCREFGMRYLGRHSNSNTGGMADVFHISGDQIPKTGVLSKFPRIANAYQARFG